MGTGDSYITSLLLWKQAAGEAFLLVNIVNHSGLLSALKRGDTTADTLISESIYFLSLSCVIHPSRCGGRTASRSSSAAGNTTPPQKSGETSTKCETQITQSEDGFPPLGVKWCDSCRVDRVFTQ